MGYTWYYSDVANQKVGSMICTNCKHSIHTGEYRYRETDEAYLAQHRHCSTDDKAWSGRDVKRAKCQEADRVRLRAYKSFRDKWDESALDEEIEEMELAGR